MLERIGKALQGKKTWVVSLLIAAGAVLQYQGIAIPDIVWPVLAALGLGAVRSAIKKIEPKK